MAGKICLIKLVLTFTTLYYLSLFRALVAVCKSITRIQRRFLWGLGKEKESISWVSWKVLCKPREEGGLGLRDIRMFNSTLLTKWRWRLMGGRAREMEGFVGIKVWLEFRSLAFTSETSIVVVERLTQSL